MGVRFLAACVDGSVGALVAAGVFFALLHSSYSLNLHTFRAVVLPIIVAAYMLVTEYYLHGSVGKHLLQIEVQSDTPKPRYPSFSQLLLRETVGKFISAVVLGLGFLVGFLSSKNKTWSDKLARTVVVTTGRNSGARKALLILPLLAFSLVVDYGLGDATSRYQQNLAEQVRATERQVEDLHFQIIKPFLGSEPQTMTEYQQKIGGVASLLEEYDRLLATEEELVSTSGRFAKPGLSLDSMRLDIYRNVIGLRRQISFTIRGHVQMVLARDRRQALEAILQARKQMLVEVKDRNDSLNAIGGAYIPKQLVF